MDIYEAKEFANALGVKLGAAMGGLVLVITASLEEAMPAFYVWVSCLILGYVTFNLSSLALYAWAVGQWVMEPQPEPEPEPPTAVSPSPPPAPAAALEPVRTVKGSVPAHWIVDTDWAGLVAWVRQPDAPLSRRALSEARLVDQRFYSLKESGMLPFPQLMVKIGAAIALDGGQAYMWSAHAPAVLARLQQQLETTPPTPKPGSGGSTNNRL